MKPTCYRLLLPFHKQIKLWWTYIRYVDILTLMINSSSSKLFIKKSLNLFSDSTCLWIPVTGQWMDASPDSDNNGTISREICHVKSDFKTQRSVRFHYWDYASGLISRSRIDGHPTVSNKEEVCYSYLQYVILYFVILLLCSLLRYYIHRSLGFIYNDLVV